MNRTVIIILVLMMACFAKPSVGLGESIEYLAQWEGKYPATTINFMPYPKGKSFMDDKNVRNLVEKNVPKNISRQILSQFGGNSRDSPILLVGSILIVNTGMRHAMTSASLFFDLTKNNVQICWQDEGNSYWFGRTKIEVPFDFCRSGTIKEYEKMNQY